MVPDRDRVAVIGSGIAGLTAAYILQRRYDVLLFEAAPTLGGHSHTHDVLTPDRRALALDTGFIVHNERTYPTVLRLFRELGVSTQDTEMSMSIRCRECRLEYAGARGFSGLFPSPRNAVRRRYLHMLAQVPRFHRQARRFLDDPHTGELTLAQFLAAGRFSRYFVHHFVYPLVSTVWSADDTTAGGYPARALFVFLRNHGALSIGGSPQWRTIVGGSRRYVEAAVKGLTAVRIATPVRTVCRDEAGFEVHDDSDERHRVSRVVIATHADEALRLLARPGRAERRVLGAFRYSRNEALLHTDPRPLPSNPRIRSAWNHLKQSCHSTATQLCVSYDLNRLQRLDEPVDYVTTLGDHGQVDRSRILARMTYEHPIYTTESVAARDSLPGLNDGRIAYAGAYHGAGFHEDGCTAGVRAAESFGVTW